MVTREAERVPPFSLDKERYDQTHFMGRWQNTMEMTSPSNLLASDARITAALTLLKSFQVRRFASSYNQPLYIVHAAPPRQNTVRDVRRRRRHRGLISIYGWKGVGVDSRMVILRMPTRLTRHRTREANPAPDRCRGSPHTTCCGWGGGKCRQDGRVSKGVRHVRWCACIGLSSYIGRGIWCLIPEGSCQPREGTQGARVCKRCENLAGSPHRELWLYV